MILIIFSLLLLFTGTFCIFLEYRLFYFVSRKVSSIYFNIFFCPTIEFSVLVMIRCLRLGHFLSISHLLCSSLFEAIGLSLPLPAVITFLHICNCFQLCLLCSAFQHRLFWFVTDFPVFVILIFISAFPLTILLVVLFMSLNLQKHDSIKYLLPEGFLPR